MNADLWRRARDIFDVALEKQPRERVAYVRSAAGGDTELLREVESLLKAHEESTDRFEDSPAALIPNAELFAPEVGQHIGPWLLVRKIGEGGAGVVYAAARDDASYQKMVALKLLRPDRDSREMVRRFRLERQVLASLDHTNIARMFDAGTTQSGRPYLVMEYVEGVTVDQWCESGQVTLEQRLKIFLQVLDAVGCAHRNLVVHCDLKPANILVTAEGVPKLLDFGIAKLLRPELAPEIAITRSFGRMLTPEYASPEQVRGEPVKTAVDIYALGVLLYRLLTGNQPYEFPSDSIADIERVICQVEPKRPSLFDSKLSGDLEAILLKALRKEPRFRYPSAEQFSADIDNYLKGRPVSAHKGTHFYYVGKFVRRHRLEVGTVALVLTSLVTAAAVSIYYARAANRRFQQASELTRFVLFNFDDAIRSGQTNARRVLVSEGLEYLKRLSAEAGSDEKLNRELAQAYLKMGDIQGNPFAENIGDVRGARETFRIALAHAQALQDPTMIAAAEIKLADVESMAGDRHQGLRLYQKALSAFDSLPQNLANERLRAETIFKMAFANWQAGNTKKALQGYEESIGLARNLWEQHPRDPETTLLYVRAMERAGLSQADSGDRPGGIARLSGARELMEEFAASNPENAEYARRAFACSMVLADVLSRSDRPAEAEFLYRRMLGTADERARKDPANVLFQRDRYVAMARLASLLETMPAKHNEARRLTKEALEILRPIVAQPDAGVYDLHQYVWLLVKTPFADLRNPVAALPYAERAVARTNSTDAALLDVLACAYAGAGESEKAVQTERKALALLPPAEPNSKTSGLRAELEKNLADFEQKANKARDFRR